MPSWWQQPCVIGPRIAVNGYARFPSGKRGVHLYAHRVIWEQTHGPIPDGYHVHHVCGTKACINIEHLELHTASEHRSLHSRKCNHGDRKPNGVCRVCERDWRRAYERNRYHTEPAYRAKKIARAAAYKRRKKGGGAEDAQLVATSV